MYSSEISRRNPTLFGFLFDCSGSMADAFGNGDGQGRSKASALTDVANQIIHNIVIRCAKGERVLNYFYLAPVGYGGHVRPAFGGSLSGMDIVSIEDVCKNPLRVQERMKKVSDGAGGLAEVSFAMPIWLEPVADGGTPMREAFTYAKKIIDMWVRDHADSYPPILINITDGESTDGDPEEIARDIMALKTTDGNVLVFNIHLSSHKSTPILFPDKETILVDDYSKMLFRMSSTLPPSMLAVAKLENFVVSESSRGFVFNSDLVSLISFLDIGTRPSNLR